MWVWEQYRRLHGIAGIVTRTLRSFQGLVKTILAVRHIRYHNTAIIILYLSTLISFDHSMPVREYVGAVSYVIFLENNEPVLKKVLQH